jgi:uncharacterized protein (TIRG00374 family)
LAGFLVILFFQYLTSVQMCWVMGKQTTTLSTYRIFVVNLVTRFYGLFLPGTLAGGAVRWYQFKKSGVAAADALAAIIFNRLFETILLVGFGALFLAADVNKISNITGLSAIPFISLLLVATYYVLFNPRFHSLLVRIHQRLTNRGTWRSNLQKLVDALARYNVLNTGFRLKLLVMGITRQVIGIIGIYIFALALDIEISFYTLAWVRSVFTLLVMLPISISGLGVRELTFVSILTQYGVPAGSALMLSLVLFFRGLIFALVGGLYELKRVFPLKRGTKLT